MPTYTICFLAGDGCRVETEEIVFDNEALALRIMENWAKTESVELWDGTRRIFPPEQAGHPPNPLKPTDKS